MRDLAPTDVARAVALIESGQTYRAVARAPGARGGSSGEATEAGPHPHLSMNLNKNLLLRIRILQICFYIIIIL
jgi:hypothetical protein